jgi:copper chaperone CopZ
MIRATRLLAASLALLLGSSAFAAEAKIEKTHLCCQSCLKGVATAVGTVNGAKAACDQKTGTVTITAADEATCQKAVDAVLAAGYYGTVTGAKVAEDKTSGKAKEASVTGVHNCCKKCTTALNGAIGKVQGAKGEFAAKADNATLTGDFDAKAVVEALHAAGFNAKVAAK